LEGCLYAQDHQDDTSALLELVADTSQASLIEYLRILSTAEGSRVEDMSFYQEMSEMLETN
jgi:hypothetical protein